MRTVREIFDASMGLIDELGSKGESLRRETEEYQRRTPSIINMMISEYRLLSGERGGFVPMESLEDMVLRIDDAYALGVMQYGLAANLLVDENPAAAGFYQQRYEELRNIYFSRRMSDGGEAIEDIYGGIEFGQFARW